MGLNKPALSGEQRGCLVHRWRDRQVYHFTRPTGHALTNLAPRSDARLPYRHQCRSDRRTRQIRKTPASMDILPEFLLHEVGQHGEHQQEQNRPDADTVTVQLNRFAHIHQVGNQVTHSALVLRFRE